MYIENIATALTAIRANMDNPTLPVKSVDALGGTVQFMNGVEYSLTTFQRVK